jgi:quinol monooxygenase YgiN
MIALQNADGSGTERGSAMVEKTVRLTVNFVVKKDQLEEFKRIAQEMTAGSRMEPGTLGYEWFASIDGGRHRLVETYVDSSAVEAHFMGPVVQQLVPRIAAVCTVDGFEIYGDPGPKVAATAAGLGAVIFGYWLGIDR